MPHKRTEDFELPEEGKTAAAFDYAEARVNNNFLVGARFTLADITLCAAVDYVDLRYAHNWRDTHPRLAGWLRRVSARPCLATAPQVRCKVRQRPAVSRPSRDGRRET